MYYFFYLDEFYTIPKQDNLLVWEEIKKDLIDRFGLPGNSGTDIGR